MDPLSVDPLSLLKLLCCEPEVRSPQDSSRGVFDSLRPAYPGQLRMIFSILFILFILDLSSPENPDIMRCSIKIWFLFSPNVNLMR
ncbi:hypothetical protein Glove_433g14 [Diversispora epigaea]|uniref:Uncharacterized protein n=1 Tax=Diversispora epigaea TaxID=1348612 RepID=A0A397GW48_9GLOM|nr:hypothetical protein Glove_433g14 [Diversispora epigaea]